MANIKKGNEYIVDKENNIAKIKVERKTGEILWYTIDLEDLERVLDFPYTWFALKYNEATDDWYAGCSEYHPELQQSRPYYLHQFIMNNRTERIDHINGYRNVCWIKRENMWVVQLQIDGKNKRLAKFPKDKLEEAGKFAEEMRKKYYGEEFAGGN